MLCLPGLTRNARDFADLAERYSPRFRVSRSISAAVASDYDPQPARYNPADLCRRTWSKCSTSSASPQAIFVGTSLGGLVTMAIAATAPERIAASILNDVGPDVDPQASIAF